MTYMIFAACFLGESQVTLNLLPLALGADALMTVSFCIGALMNISAVQKTVVLAMGDNYFSELFCFKHCPAHRFFCLNSAAVIGKGNHLIGKRLHIGKLRALPAYGYRTVGNDVDRSIPFDNIKLFFEVLRTIRHGIKIRHCANRCVTALCGGK